MRGIASGLILGIGKIIASFAPYAGTFCKNNGIHPLVGCGAPLLLSIPLGFFLPETLSTAKNSDEFEIESNSSKMNEENDLSEGFSSFTN